MDVRDIVGLFDGRPVVELTVWWPRNDFDAQRAIALSYECGYVLARAGHSLRHPQVKLSFERVDSAEARQRAAHTFHSYRMYAMWVPPQSVCPLPEHLLPRVSLKDVIYARHSLAMGGRWDVVRGVLAMEFMLGAVAWGLRDVPGAVLGLLIAAIVVVPAALLLRWLSRGRLERFRRLVELFELQQAVERGHRPPP